MEDVEYPWKMASTDQIPFAAHRGQCITPRDTPSSIFIHFNNQFQPPKNRIEVICKFHTDLALRSVNPISYSQIAATRLFQMFNMNA